VIRASLESDRCLSFARSLTLSNFAMVSSTRFPPVIEVIAKLKSARLRSGVPSFQRSHNCMQNLPFDFAED
jgi:hypothetical protein